MFTIKRHSEEVPWSFLAIPDPDHLLLKASSSYREISHLAFVSIEMHFVFEKIEQLKNINQNIGLLQLLIRNTCNM